MAQISPTEPQQRFHAMRQVTLVGAAVNLLLSIIKIVIGVIGHSEAMVADGIHSLSDLLSDGLVYFAAHHARQGPDAEHPYGYGRFETVATMGLGILLILVAAGIVWDSATRLFQPETLLQPDVSVLFAAIFSILVKEALYHYTLRVGRRINSDMLKANAWHHRSDAISSIVVLVGVMGTMAGLVYLDAVAAVLVGLMIGKIGWELGWGAVKELVDAALDESRIQEIRKTIMAVGGVRDIHMLRTRSLGGAASADVHVLVDPRLSVSEGHMISASVEQRLKQRIDEISDVTVHIDPEDDETAPPCAGLPLRAEALAMLDRLWTNNPEVAQRQRVTLHYLSGKIDVEVFFPVGTCDSRQQVVDLRKRLQDALAPAPEFNRVHVYFG